MYDLHVPIQETDSTLRVPILALTAKRSCIATIIHPPAHSLTHLWTALRRSASPLPANLRFDSLSSSPRRPPSWLSAHRGTKKNRDKTGPLFGRTLTDARGHFLCGKHWNYARYLLINRLFEVSTPTANHLHNN